jgi:hypothetical protein
MASASTADASGSKVEPWAETECLVIPVLYQTWAPVKESELAVEWDPEVHARKSGTDEQEAELKSTWDARRGANSRLFNGTKFRLASWSITEGSAPLFRMGVTSYRAFQGTNASKQAAALFKEGTRAHGDCHACMGNALGIGMAVVTTDGDILFIRRSHHVGEAKGLVDVVGGHAEPHAAGLAPDRWDHDDVAPPDWEPAPKMRSFDGSLSASESDTPVSAEAAARRELFVSPLDEIDEELNASRGTLGEPLLIGLSTNATTGGRVSTAYAGEPPCL